jgi:hypothetical protein
MKNIIGDAVANIIGVCIGVLVITGTIKLIIMWF